MSYDFSTSRHSFDRSNGRAVSFDLTTIESILITQPGVRLSRAVRNLHITVATNGGLCAVMHDRAKAFFHKSSCSERRI